MSKEIVNERNIKSLANVSKTTQERLLDLEEQNLALKAQISGMETRIAQFQENVQKFIASSYGSGPTQ